MAAVHCPLGSALSPGLGEELGGCHDPLDIGPRLAVPMRARAASMYRSVATAARVAIPARPYPVHAP